MQNCTHCGSELVDSETFCKYCGLGLGETKTVVIKNEPYSVFYFLGGLIVPLFGVIGYFYLRKTKQKQAKALGVGALLYFMFFCFGSFFFLALVEMWPELMSV